MDHPTLKDIADAAMQQRSLEPRFPEPALREAEALQPIAAHADPALRDLRELLWCSIDNDDSRDLDQLTVAHADGEGQLRVLVAIADVDVLVRPGSAIDAHARINTTSVYTAAGVYPMLPLRLSTDLSSLNEAQDRAAIVIEVRIGADGVSADGDVYRAWVRNRAQLTYDGVAAWLDGKAPPPPRLAAVPGLEDQLRQQDRAGQALHEARRRQGALSLSTPEARPVFLDGVLTDLRVDGNNRAKDLIASFMIAANGVSARYLDRKGSPSLRRLLRQPERWDKITSIALGLGETLPAAPNSIALDAFLARQRAAAPDKFAELSLSIVKLLGSGEYAMTRPGQTPTGHFGLAVNDYTHSTAPNRRYPDLITHRLLKAAIAGAAPPFSDAELNALAQHCTVQEDNAAKVERQVRKSAAAVLLAPRVGQRFEGIVTGVSGKGTWVRISHPIAEGRIVQGFAGLDVADRVRVELVSVDARQGFIDFRSVD
ncbi:MAG: RNB domain-containing ribonuclease [Burkholderiales bacterium]